MKLSEFQCDVAGHVLLWFGSGNSAHVDKGYVSTSPLVVAKQYAAMAKIGIKVVNPLWSGDDASSDRMFSTLAVINWMRFCESNGTSFFLTIDHPESFSPGSINMLQVFMSSKSYYQWQGKPIVLAFNPLSDAQLAAMPAGVAIVYRNASGLTVPGSSGAFSWIAPPTQANPQQTPDSYTKDFIARTASARSAGNSLIIDHVCPGFTRAAWNTTVTADVPWRVGQEWEDSKNRVPANPQMVLVCTWNDHDEHTGIEGSYLQ